VTTSGGASYGAEGLKPLQFLLQPLQNFCVKQYIVSRSIFLRTKIKIAVTGCHILRLKCTKIDFFCGSAPDPAGELTAFPRPLAGFKGSYFKGRGAKGKGRTEGKGLSAPRKNWRRHWWPPKVL